MPIPGEMLILRKRYGLLRSAVKDRLAGRTELQVSAHRSSFRAHAYGRAQQRAKIGGCAAFGSHEGRDAASLRAAISSVCVSSAI